MVRRFQGGARLTLAALIVDFHGAVYLLAEPGDQLFGQVHQVMIGGIGLIELEHGELGVVPGGEPFVAEVAVDLEDPLKAADQQPFQVELRGDAQVEVHVQRVVMGLERLGGGASGDRLHHRGLDLHEAAVIQIFADQPDDLDPFAEDVSRVSGVTIRST